MGFWPMKCALGWDFYARLWGSMALPFFLVFLALLYTLARGRVKREADWLDRAFLQGCAVMIFYLMFPSSTKSLLLGNPPPTCYCHCVKCCPHLKCVCVRMGSGGVPQVSPTAPRAAC